MQTENEQKRLCDALVAVLFSVNWRAQLEMFEARAFDDLRSVISK